MQITKYAFIALGCFTAIASGQMSGRAVAQPPVKGGGTGRAMQKKALMQSSADFEKIAVEAEMSGRLKEAFTGYIRAFDILGETAPCVSDVRLREKILAIARRLDTLPTPPQRARKIFEGYALAANGKPTPGALEDLTTVLALAPWWPDPYAAVGRELESAGRLGEAATAYRLFLAGARAESEIKIARTRLSKLEAASPKPTEEIRGILGDLIQVLMSENYCIPCNTACTLHGTECCGTCVCEGKFPNTTCTDW